MKFKRVVETVDFASGKVSDGVRTLAFAGFALIWVFKKQLPDGTLALDSYLNLPAAFLIVALLADVCQYALIVHKYRGIAAPKRPTDLATDAPFDPGEQNVPAPKHLRALSDWAFWTKLAFVAAAHAMLLLYALIHIRFSGS
jgi:hypothetical protein